MKFNILIFLTFLIINCSPQVEDLVSSSENKIDYLGFERLTYEISDYRMSRLVDIKKFNKLSRDKQTIILDTRSKSAFDEVHVSGAVHLNFSDFTEQKLKEIIPSKDTRVLIYCNNNLRSEMSALMDKKIELALNIPTFINLYGYGYENIYELDGYLDEHDDRIHLTYDVSKTKPKSTVKGVVMSVNK